MTAWSEDECELIVQDYLDRLTFDLQGVSFNKAQRKKNLIPVLSGRSEGAVEYKDQNISAAMIEIGLPYIKGYKPVNFISLIGIMYLKTHRF